MIRIEPAHCADVIHDAELSRLEWVCRPDTKDLVMQLRLSEDCGDPHLDGATILVVFRDLDYAIVDIVGYVMGIESVNDWSSEVIPTKRNGGLFEAVQTVRAHLMPGLPLPQLSAISLHSGGSIQVACRAIDVSRLS